MAGSPANHWSLDAIGLDGLGSTDGEVSPAAEASSNQQLQSYQRNFGVAPHRLSDMRFSHGSNPRPKPAGKWQGPPAAVAEWARLKLQDGIPIWSAKKHRRARSTGGYDV